MKIGEILSYIYLLGIRPESIFFRNHLWCWSWELYDYVTTINGARECLSDSYNLFTILHEDVDYIPSDRELWLKSGITEKDR